MNLRILGVVAFLTLIGTIFAVGFAGYVNAAETGDDEPTPEAEIICDPSQAVASKNLDFKVRLKNYSVPSSADLYVKVTVTWDMFNWQKTHEYSNRFSMDPGYDKTHYGEFHSLVPGPGYVMRCELREDRRGFLGIPDRTIASNASQFTVREYQRGENRKKTPGLG